MAATITRHAVTHAIIGTAGHIDHGKTALIKALTGQDTDRLKEEKERGISVGSGGGPGEIARGDRAPPEKLRGPPAHRAVPPAAGPRVHHQGPRHGGDGNRDGRRSAHRPEAARTAGGRRSPGALDTGS